MRSFFGVGAHQAESRRSLRCREQGFIRGVLEKMISKGQEQSFAAASFEAIFGWMVLEHTEAPRETLDEAFRLLTPGGLLALSVPDFAAWDRRLFGAYWRGLELPRHLQHFTPATLEAALTRSGFDVERVIHQRSAFNIVCSVGLLLREWRATRGLGQRLIDFTDSPSMLGELALAPLAKVLGVTRQSGRMTVLARKPPAATRETAI